MLKSIALRTRILVSLFCTLPTYVMSMNIDNEKLDVSSRYLPSEIIYNNPCALHLACEKGNAQRVELLIAAGASINTRDASGRSPLHRAAESGQKKITKFLLEHNGSVNIRDYFYQTPLHCAGWNGNKDIAELLIRFGALIDAQDINNWTPLHCAVEYDQRETTKVLIDHDASIDIQDHDGCTPLHLAILHSCKEITALLINAHASIDIENNDGLTALHYAFSSGDQHIIELLLTNGTFSLPRIHRSTIPGDLKAHCLFSLLENLDHFDEKSQKHIIKFLAYNPELTSKQNIVLLIDQLPLKFKRELIRLWNSEQSLENQMKIRLFIAEQVKHHFYRMKNMVINILATHPCTAYDTTDIEEQQYKNQLNTFLNVASFNDNNMHFQQAVKNNIERKLLR